MKTELTISDIINNNPEALCFALAYSIMILWALWFIITEIIYGYRESNKKH